MFDRNQLYVKLEKYISHLPSISFQGFILEKGILWMDPASQVAEELARIVHQVQGFLGFAIFFCRFIRGLSSIAALLMALTDKGSSPQMHNKLRVLFTTAVHILRLPDPEKPFSTHCWSGCLRGRGVEVVICKGQTEEAPHLGLLLALSIATEV